MDRPFDLVAFLARSENRHAALEALAEQSYSRPELQAAVDVPRATLSRILADFWRRDLVVRENGRYEITPLGTEIAIGLEALFESIESTRALQTVAAWLPLDELDVAITEVADVEVTLPTAVDPMAPVKRAAELIDDVTRVRGFCYSVVHAPILAECRNVVERGHRFEGVIAAGVFEVVAGDPVIAPRIRQLLAEGRTDLFVYEGNIEPQLIIADRTTMFLVSDDGGAIQGLVTIGDEAILPWAEETFESIKADAEPLDPDALSERLAP